VVVRCSETCSAVGGPLTIEVEGECSWPGPSIGSEPVGPRGTTRGASLAGPGRGIAWHQGSTPAPVRSECRAQP
jgi:hypothetical protein